MRINPFPDRFLKNPVYFFFADAFSPPAFFISFSRSSFLRILPEIVLGSDSTYSTARGYL